MRLLFALVLTLLATKLALGQDDPDESLEGRFHQIYLNYNREPTNTQAWGQALSKSKSQQYQIQSGDTLWEISDTLFGDPFFWPKVWSLNGSDITNPHEISKDDKIHFFAGTLADPPSLTIESNQLASAQESSEEFPGNMVIQIPPPTRESKPPSPLPSSFPNWEYRRDKDAIIEMEMEKLDRKFANFESLLSFSVTSNLLNGLGKVVETDLDNDYAGFEQTVYVKFNQVPVEKEWFFFKQSRNLEDVFNKKNHVIVQYLGEGVLGELVNPQANVYRVRVTTSLSPVELTAQLLPGRIPRFIPENFVGDSKEVAARVIGGQHSSQRNLFGERSIIYINAGQSQGLVDGDLVTIYRWPSFGKSFSFVKENLMSVGRAKVLKADASISTAYLFESVEGVRLGDVTASKVAPFRK